jgi:hypothetical protein
MDGSMLWCVQCARPILFHLCKLAKVKAKIIAGLLQSGSDLSILQATGIDLRDSCAYLAQWNEIWIERLPSPLSAAGYT